MPRTSRTARGRCHKLQSQGCLLCTAHAPCVMCTYLRCHKSTPMTCNTFGQSSCGGQTRHQAGKTLKGVLDPRKSLIPTDATRSYEKITKICQRRDQTCGAQGRPAHFSSAARYCGNMRVVFREYKSTCALTVAVEQA